MQEDELQQLMCSQSISGVRPLWETIRSSMGLVDFSALHKSEAQISSSTEIQSAANPALHIVVQTSAQITP